MQLDVSMIMAARYSFILLLFVVLCCYGASASAVKIIVILPLEGSSAMSPKWAKGFEIQIGAHVALERIQNSTTMIIGNNIELLYIDSRSCYDTERYNNILVSYFNLTYPSTGTANNVIGVVGDFCSITEMDAAPIIEHGNLQILGSSLFRNKRFDKQSRSFHIIQPFSEIATALFLLMNNLGWNELAVIFESQESYSASTLLTVSNSFPNITISSSITYTNVHKAIFSITNSNNRVTFLSLKPKNILNILCEAYLIGLVWPDYVWLTYNYHIADYKVYQSSTRCNGTEFLNGVLLFQHQLEQMDPAERIVSGLMFADYKRMFSKFTDPQGNQIQYNVYANALHDAIWSIALAFNASNSTDYSVLIDEVKKLTFNGATGKVKFNMKGDVITGVDIKYINNSCVDEVIAHYNSTNRSILVSNKFYSGNIKLFDNPSIVHNRIPTAFVYIFYINIMVFMLLLTIILFFYIYFHKEPNIKASSVALSMFMFASCYLSLIYLTALTLQEHINSNWGKDVICIIRLWLNGLSLPLPLIFATLIVKILRVYHIFNFQHKIGKQSSNIALTFYVFLILSPCLLILLLRSILDPFKNTITAIKLSDHTMVMEQCSSKYLLTWHSLLIIYLAILLLSLSVIAIKTRKIRERNFKDTKKVNGFIFIIILLTGMTISYWYILRAINADRIIVQIMLHIAHVAIVIACQGFLFVPKLFPIIWGHFQSKSNSNYNGSDTQFTSIFSSKAAPSLHQ